MPEYRNHPNPAYHERARPRHRRARRHQLRRGEPAQPRRRPLRRREHRRPRVLPHHRRGARPHRPRLARAARRRPTRTPWRRGCGRTPTRPRTRPSTGPRSPSPTSTATASTTGTTARSARASNSSSTTPRATSWSARRSSSRPRTTGATRRCAQQPSVIAPPAKFKIDPYYTKFTFAREFPVLGSKHVSDEALLKANDTIRKMFAYRHDILKAMIADGARLVVLGREEKLSDLPEFKDAKNKAELDQVRYLDYTPTLKLMVVPEENVLGLAERAVRGQVHGGQRLREGAVPRRRAAAGRSGLRQAAAEAAVRAAREAAGRRVRQAAEDSVFEAATEKGLWKGTPAARDRVEYWAAGVEAYFDAAGTGVAPNGADRPDHHARGAQGVRPGPVRARGRDDGLQGARRLALQALDGVRARSRPSSCSRVPPARTIPRAVRAPSVIAGTPHARRTTEFRTTPPGRRARFHRVDRDQHARRRSDTSPTASNSSGSPRTRSGNNSPSSAASSGRASRSSATPRRSSGRPQRSSRGNRTPRRARRGVAQAGRRDATWMSCCRRSSARPGSRDVGRARSRQDGGAREQGDARRRRAAGDGTRGRSAARSSCRSIANTRRSSRRSPGTRPKTSPASS